jgi:hypothetical protein
MSIPKLASSLGQRDEIPNIRLAEEIAGKNDAKAVQELIENLEGKPAIQSDCIKVLYEIGERNPELIAGYTNVFVDLLSHKNNRLQWGAMTALDAIAYVAPDKINKLLSKIMASADSGSVITRDHAVGILVKLCSGKKYYSNAFSLLIEQLQTCPSNQLPMYAEMSLPILADKDKNRFISVLQSRMGDMEKESKKKRVEKVIKKIS